MLEWGAEMFSYGYSIEYINSMCYWDYLELIKGMSSLQKQKAGKKSKGHFASGGELTDTQRKMIENRKKLHGK